MNELGKSLLVNGGAVSFGALVFAGMAHGEGYLALREISLKVSIGAAIAAVVGGGIMASSSRQPRI